MALYAFVVVRALRRAINDDDPFRRFAVAGLAILFGLQSAINMSVNLHLIPAKGMTLPFISYGGSSMISLAYGMGMLLALTRERPRSELFARPGRARGRGEPGLMPGGGAAPLVLLAAGGTGGHLFPAEALADALARRGLTVELATDERAERYGKRFPARQIHVIASETVRGRNVVALARTGAIMSLALLRAAILLATHQARRGGGLRRLSDARAGPGRDLAAHSDRHPRAERRHGARQQAAGAAGERDRDSASPACSTPRLRSPPRPRRPEIRFARP